MNFKDVELMNQSFGGLAETILRNRMLSEQKADKERGYGLQERELGMRDEELKRRAASDTVNREMEREKLDYEKDPNNPRNQEQTSLAKYHNEQMKQLGVKTIKSTWQTEDGRNVNFDGPTSDLPEAVKANPPSRSKKQRIEFTTKDGVKHTIEATPEELQAQTEAFNKSPGIMEQSPHTASAIQVTNEIENHRARAAQARDDGDEELAKFEEGQGTLLQQYLTKATKAPPSLRKTVTTEERGRKTTLGGPAALVDEAMTNRTATATGGAAAGKAPVKVSTKAERDKLPKGTHYLGPDGKLYTKQ